MRRVIADRSPTFATDSTDVVQALGWPIVIAPNSGGYGVFASRDVAAGERVLAECPFALTVSIGKRVHTCSTCLADSRSAGSPAWTTHCVGGCNTQRYCSIDCQATAAASFHPPNGTECTAMSTAQSDARHDFETSDDISQAVRILERRQAGACVHMLNAAGKSVPIDGSSASAELRLDYEGYSSRLVGIAPATPEDARSLRRATGATLSALPEACRVPHAELRDLLQRHACNSFGTHGGGVASFIGFMHLFNHACRPNCVLDHATTLMSDQPHAQRAFAVVALENIPAGGELVISYLSHEALFGDTPCERRAHLLEHYGFKCGCDRCKETTDEERDGYSAWLMAIRCPYADQGCSSGMSVPCVGSNGGSRWCVHCGRSFVCAGADTL